ncbi:MAG: hypothetical protein KJO35_03525 [Gammaproteobacteria bacterium]|nr:hypothetical protein [Gammaproteobacteria bacterium]
MLSDSIHMSRILIAVSSLMLGGGAAMASDSQSKADKYFVKAVQYEQQGDLDKAAKYRAKAERYAGEDDHNGNVEEHYEGAEDEGLDSYQTKAEKYAAKAARYAAAGDLEKAAKYAAKALKYANEGNDSKAAKYAAKAELAALEGDLDKARYYAEKAAKYADKYNANCWPEVNADFDSDGFSVSVESSKDLSNVVLLFADGTTERISWLEGNELTLAGGGVHLGKMLTGVWVKSGCNHSGDGPGYGEFIENSANVTGLPVVSISGTPNTFEMHDGMLTEALFTVSLSEMVPLDGEDITVTLLTHDGLAIAGEDYIAEEVSLTFEPGDISLQFSILIIGDRVMETQEENYSVQLVNPENAILGQSWANGWIFDDDDTDY